MAHYLIKDTTLTEIGDAIRAKTGETVLMTPFEMVNAIRDININNGSEGGSTDGTTVNFISEQIHVDTTSQNTFVTLLSGNSFVADNYNNPNLFVGLIASNLDTMDSSAYSNSYQWTTLFASNKVMTINSIDSWYGVGIYSMGGKGQTFSSTLQIPYSLNNISNTNYSYLNTTSSGDIRAYICNYDVLLSGDYIVIAGLF